jgi:aubergine-like protein
MQCKIILNIKPPCMIVGFDSMKFQRKGRKCVMSATYDRTFSKVMVEEEIQDFDVDVAPVASLLRKCLDRFGSQNNGHIPQFILFYRSGVSEIQKNVLLNHEVRSVTNLLSGELERECYKEGKKIKINYLIVNKRADSKIFESNHNKLNNPKEGTVIDTQAIHPDYYEFYLQPHYVNQGTATPTHFHSIYDDAGLGLETVETITYNMSYYYWNWSGPIRTPAPLKFAEVANKFSTIMQDYTHERLKNTPYYI